MKVLSLVLPVIDFLKKDKIPIYSDFCSFLSLRRVMFLRWKNVLIEISITKDFKLPSVTNKFEPTVSYENKLITLIAKHV